MPKLPKQGAIFILFFLLILKQYTNMSLLSQNVIPGNHGKTLEQTRWKKTI
jgi:hypothetical protein